MSLDRKPEILAPAGTLEAVQQVIDAGADAVYVGGKGLNMRQHRASYNLTEPQIGEAIEFVHGRGKKLYFTLNSLIRDSQMAPLRSTLAMLGRLGPDALIVQDLAVASLAREICVQIPLHASTMMNVHNAQTALALKMMGFARIIPSRDIPLHEIRRIREQSGLEMECFVHGDMCISQSSQCYLSGILFGDSANCGRCMKPCRWQWKLASTRADVEMPPQGQGYLLARKDLCLLSHIPALIQNEIAALKIEGRMRSAEFLAPVVTLYRKAVDAYFEDPAAYATNAGDMQQIFAQRVRDMTTAHSFSNPAGDGIEISGKREPRFFSHAAPASGLTIGPTGTARPMHTTPELIVHVSRIAGAQAAVEGGAEAVYFCHEGYSLHGPAPKADALIDFARQTSRTGVRVGVLMPHVCDERGMAEWRRRLQELGSLGSLTIGGSSLGGLQTARDLRCRDLLADYPLNVTNAIAADELSTMGASRVTASVELTLGQLAELMAAVRMPVEVIAQGPICGMLLEHCILATAWGENPQGFCSMRCRRAAYAMEDAGGQKHPLEFDRRCRNHLFTAADVCVLPNLKRLVALGFSGLRLECQLDKPETVGTITRVYREAINRLKAGEPMDADNAVAEISAATGRPLSDGPFDFRSVSPTEKESDLVRT